MKPYVFVFIILSFILATLAIALSIDSPQAASGAVHPDFGTMSQGGDAGRHEGRLLGGWLYGSLQIGLFVLLIGQCVPSGRSKRWLIAASGGLYLAVYIGLILSYRKGVEGAPFILGFPFPTAWLVFGMWPISALFAVLYTTQYDNWIYTPEDAKRFQTIKERYQGDSENGS
jgi:hypothetical protein